MIKLQVIGNIGQNAKVTEVSNSKAINFSVAHNKKFTDKHGVVHEKPMWINCTYWRRDNASVEIARYLTAGTKVFVEGIPETEIYMSKNNIPTATLNLQVSMIELVSGKKDEGASQSESQSQSENSDNLPY